MSERVFVVLLKSHGFLMRRLDFKTFCEQEKALVLLNLGVLAGLFVIHVAHFSMHEEVGLPGKSLLVAFGLRFLWQMGDFLWLQTRESPLARESVEMLARLSIVIHLSFAWLVTLFGDSERSHYIVLMSLPVAAAGFRFGWVGASAVWATAAVHAFFEVWFSQLVLPTFEVVEYFEAATIALLYLVVGIATSLLARQLYAREAELEQSLRDLELTREAKIAAERQAAIGSLSRSVAHEIRNPVGMIVTSLAVWKESKSKNLERAGELLEIVDHEAKRLEKLTSDFLEFARERRLEKRESDLRDVMELALSMATAQAQLAGVHLHLNLGGSLSGWFDPFAVQQVLLNLLRNAIEATPPGRNIRVWGVREQGYLKLIVENEGEKIRDEVVARFFQPFESTKPQGSGLGMAISQSIAKAHGGELVLIANTAGRVAFALHIPDSNKEAEEHGTRLNR